ncbi:PD-(D/E)XK nuclease family protein [Planctomycetota bacterium]
MSIRFILGRSGSGKTTLCTEEVVESLVAKKDNQPLLFLVPEQATYQIERAVLGDQRIAGFGGAQKQSGSQVGNLNILSFSRLQFLLFGKRTAKPQLSRIGREMVIQRILRQNHQKLKIFEEAANFPGMAHQLAQTIAELHQYDKTPDDIDALVEQLGRKNSVDLAALKFADISLLLKEYLDFIEGRFVDPDVQLRDARRAVGQADFVKGAKIWVDGFAGFTTSQLAMLAELLKRSSVSKIALCLDPANFDLTNPDAQILPEDLFYPTEQTYAQLLELIKKCRLRLDKPIVLKEAHRFSNSRQLAHIEANIFADNPQKISSYNDIRIISAANARAEVKLAARQIMKLVRNNGFRFRDIAVIAPDIERYRHYIKAHFDDYQIPFFIDRRLFLNQHPLTNLICSALDVVTNSFLHGDVFSFLKNDLVPASRCDIDLLENYCIAFGISSTDWQKDDDFSYAGPRDTEFDQSRVNEIRSNLISPLHQLKDKLCPTDKAQKEFTSSNFVQIIFELLDTLDVRRQLADWIKQAQQNQDRTTADEHRQFYDNIVDVFDELVEVFGDQKMPSQDYISIIKSAFSELSLAFIPPRLDEVLVGSIERSRHPDLKAVFLLGATQSQFPAPVGLKGLLSDDDRDAADKADFTLAADTSRLLAERQYLAYIAFTRPSRFLYITYPLVDSKGSAVVRSQFVDNLQSLFDDLDEESIAVRQIEPTDIFCESELRSLLSSRLGKDAPENTKDEELKQLLDETTSDEQLKDLAVMVRSALRYENSASLQRNITSRLFGEEVKASATRLSTFAACPYQFFAKYILELEERKEFKFEPLDIGDFYHRVLDQLVKQLQRRNKNFAAIKDTELLKILNEQISKILQKDSFLSKFRQHSPHNDYIVRSAGQHLEEFVPEMVKMIRAGSFRPAISEAAFGKIKETPDTLGEYKIKLSNNRTLLLRGKIDRLDIAEVDGKKTAVLFDYKRKSRTFSFSYLYNGIDMQLPIYMLAVKNSKTGKINVNDIAGAFYLPVESPVTQTTFEKLPTKTEKFDYKAKGIFNGQFADLLNTTPAQGWNKFYNFHISKKGTQYGNYGSSVALKPDDFEKILQFTKDKIIQLAEQIVSGKIEVAPYRLGTKSPCSNCPYKPLCRFDWQINDYTSLLSIGKKQVLEEITT